MPQVHKCTVLLFQIGRHCCLWCHATKQQMQQSTVASESSEPRTLGTLQRDLAAFRQNGSRPDKSKHFNNVIEEPIFSIPLDQVCLC